MRTLKQQGRKKRSLKPLFTESYVPSKKHKEIPPPMLNISVLPGACRIKDNSSWHTKVIFTKPVNLNPTGGGCSQTEYAIDLAKLHVLVLSVKLVFSQNRNVS